MSENKPVDPTQNVRELEVEELEDVVGGLGGNTWNGNRRMSMDVSFNGDDWGGGNDWGGSDWGGGDWGGGDWGGGDWGGGGEWI